MKRWTKALSAKNLGVSTAAASPTSILPLESPKKGRVRQLSMKFEARLKKGGEKERGKGGAGEAGGAAGAGVGEAKAPSLSAVPAVVVAAPAPASPGSEGALPFTTKLSVETLRGAVPGGEYKLVWGSKERYLTDDAFGALFGVTPSEFYTLATWRRRKLKVKAKLF
jgi:hypothetical protein